MSTAAEIFGGNSDGFARMCDWFDVMCVGCKHGRHEEGVGYGIGCEIGARGALNDDDMPEWSVDAMWPERFDVFNPDEPWPVCMAYEPRKKRWDAGLRHGPRPIAGQMEMFT